MVAYVNFSKQYGPATANIAVRDLLGISVDSIVNPANSGLSHGGGLAAQIEGQAGHNFVAECNQIIKNNGYLRVGDAVHTTSGNLSEYGIKGIINAVGPRNGDGQEKEKLENTILNILNVAEKKRYSSIAMPAISTGLFYVPVGTFAEAFDSALSKYFSKNTGSSIKHIELCLTKDAYPVVEKKLNKKSRAG